MEVFLFGQKKKKLCSSISLCIFWTVWKERNIIAFQEGSLIVQSFKNSFVYNLWSWNRVYVGEEASSLIGFFGVDSFLLRGNEASGFFEFLLFGCLYTPVYATACWLFFLMYINLFLPIKKKKKVSSVLNNL